VKCRIIALNPWYCPMTHGWNCILRKNGVPVKPAPLW
jgi:hypothetical protein